MTIQDYLEKRAGLIDKQEKIFDACTTEKRNMTVDEKSTFDNLDNAISEVEETVEKLQRFEDIKDKNFDNVKQSGFTPNHTEPKQQKDFSLGEALQKMAADALGEGRIHVQNAASGHSATIPSEGGLLINPTRSNEIMQKVYDGSEIINACQTFEIGQYSDSLEIPYINETSRANGSRWGGLRAYRASEVETPTASKTDLGKWECTLSDLKALVYVTDRLLNDAPALESLIMQQMPQEFQFKLQDEILNGEGGSKCKGIVGDTATVSVAKETGQTAATIVAENIMKMYTRCWGRSRGKAKWYYNQELDYELFTMGISIGTGGVPVFLPANGLSSQPYSTLFGKPMIPVEQCQALGTVGDIVLGDFSEYALIKKGGINTASSIHVKFLTDEMTFKFNWRINGKPKWNNVLTPYKGSSTLSPFVTLATRA